MKAKKVNEAKAVSESGEIVKFDEAGMPQLDVWLEDETIWLTQKQMGFLFGCAENTITLKIAVEVTAGTPWRGEAFLAPFAPVSRLAAS